MSVGLCAVAVACAPESALGPHAHERPGMSLAFDKVRDRIEDAFGQLRSALKAVDPSGWSESVTAQMDRIRKGYADLRQAFRDAEPNVRQGFDLQWRRLTDDAYAAQVQVMDDDAEITEMEREVISESLDALERRLASQRRRLAWEGWFVP
jgi:hypothetical protein